MEVIERLGLIKELTTLTGGIQTESSAMERLKKVGRILAIVKMLGGNTSIESAKPEEKAAPAENDVWTEDRETLQSIIEKRHELMKNPALFDVFKAINERQKDNPEYPPLFEKALDAWQDVVLEITAKVVA